MPQAPSYSRGKNFLENNPDRTDHGALNAELDEVSSSINALRVNAALLQNDDGSLKNDVVTVESLSPEVIEELTGPVGPAGPTGPIGPAGPQGVQGLKGDVGASFNADARDLSANKSLYGLQAKGFSFLAIDTGMLYFKQTSTNGDWTTGVQFGKGDTGATGPTGPAGAQGVQGLRGVQGLQGLQGLPGDDGADGLVTSIDTTVKTASLIGRTSVNAQLQVVSGQLRVVLTTS